MKKAWDIGEGIRLQREQKGSTERDGIGQIVKGQRDNR